MHGPKLLVAAFALCLVGCASSTVVKQPLQPSKEATPVATKYSIGKISAQTSDAPEHFLAAVKGHLKLELSKHGLLATEDAIAPYDTVITVNSYRMRSGFSRAMFGVLAGKDGIDSTVTVTDSKTGRVVGESQVSSYNMMAVGGEDDVARMHAQEIAKFLSGSSKN